MAVMPKLPFKKWVLLSASLSIVVFVVFVFLSSDVNAIGLVITQTSIPIYALALLCALGSVLLHAVTWKELLRSFSVKTPFRRVFSLSLVGNFVDALIPGGWSGDVFKGYLLSRDPRIDGGKTAASIVVKNVMELLVTLSVLILGVVLLAVNYQLDSQVFFSVELIALLMAVPLIALLYFSIHVDSAMRLLRGVKKTYAIIRRKPTDMVGFEAKIRSTLVDYHDGISTLKNSPSLLLKPMIFLVAAWILDLFTLYFVFSSIGYGVTLDRVIITNSVVLGLQSQGAALIGFAQAAASTLYSAMGISPIISTASSVLSGAASFGLKTVVSFFAFQFVTSNRRFLFRRHQSLAEIDKASFGDQQFPLPTTGK